MFQLIVRIRKLRRKWSVVNKVPDMQCLEPTYFAGLLDGLTMLPITEDREH